MMLIVLAIAWMVGIVATDMAGLSDSVLWSNALAGLVLAVVGQRSAPARAAGLCILVAALGGLRYEPTHALRESVTIWRLAEQGEVIVKGTVQADPTWTEEGQQVILKTEAAQREGRTGKVRGLLLLNLAPYPVYEYGQQLVVRGSVKEPPPPRRPGGFHYKDYLARKQIFALMNEPEVRLLAGNHGNPVLVTLLRFRNHCHTIIVQHIPEPQASVAGGMLLGLKAAIPDDIYTVFSANGITHVLVISGWHLGMVASVISGTARRLRANRAAIFWGSLAVLWLYVLFVGATATVLRAGVMASLVVLADVTERQTEPWTLLLAACWFLTLLNPHILWDLGFQLSALATASLFAFHTPLKQWVEAWWVVRQAPLSLAWFTDPLSVTLAAQILALPIILFHFGNLSIISPLSNVVLVPVVPYVMMLGALALGVSLVAGFIGWLAQVIWMVAWLPLAYLTEGARLLAAVPWAAVQLPPFPLWLLSGYYGTVACWWLWGQWATHREHPEPE